MRIDVDVVSEVFFDLIGTDTGFFAFVFNFSYLDLVPSSRLYGGFWNSCLPYDCWWWHMFSRLAALLLIKCLNSIVFVVFFLLERSYFTIMLKSLKIFTEKSSYPILTLPPILGSNIAVYLLYLWSSLWSFAWNFIDWDWHGKVWLLCSK